MPAASRWISALVIAALPPVSFAQGVKPATPSTQAAQERVLQSLPFSDTQDFEDARRGLIAPLPDNGVIRAADGRITWNLPRFQFASGEQAPTTVNPSLWRMMRLLSITGLFQVTPRIYQVRGADLSNITFIEGDRGVVVMDPCITAESARASLELYRKHRGAKEVVAVVITHSHVDHYGGIEGVVDPAALRAGKVRILAPEGFLEEAVSENVLAGNHMTRRATYMYGNLIPQGPQGGIGTGLGLATSSGTITLPQPTEIVRRTGQTASIDGLTFEFLMAPGSEAPAEMHFFIPELKALCPAENANHTMHNVYTLRGAKVRDARRWAGYLHETLERWGDRAEVLFAPHHWPTWGAGRVAEHLQKQRDLYKYINDQTLRLANHGFNMVEAAAAIELPPELGNYWANRGYYGSISHNVRAVWNYYLGFLDGNPARLDPLPPSQAGRRMVEYMGGSAAVMEKARRDFDRGEYRWVAQVLDHVVSAEPQNREARDLLADTLEQLGYQTENATWRNFYLTGAQELRTGVRRPPVSANRMDSLRNLPLPMVFDYLAMSLNGPKAAGKRIRVNLRFPDLKEEYSLALQHAVLNYGKPGPEADVAVTLTRADFHELITGASKLEQKVASGSAVVRGKAGAFSELLELFDRFDLWWNVATPNASIQ